MPKSRILTLLLPTVLAVALVGALAPFVSWRQLDPENPEDANDALEGLAKVRLAKINRNRLRGVFQGRVALQQQRLSFGELALTGQ